MADHNNPHSVLTRLASGRYDIDLLSPHITRVKLNAVNVVLTANGDHAMMTVEVYDPANECGVIVDYMAGLFNVRTVPDDT